MARSSSAHRSAPRGIPSSCRARGTAARGSGERSGARARGASADPQRRDRRTAGEACGDARSRSDRRRRAAEHRARPRPRRGPDGGVTLTATDVTGEVTDVVQQLIRNACVNDGTRESGHEIRTVDLLESYLRVAGAEMKRYEPMPDRARLVLRIEGSDPKAPSLHFMGHTDVVPVTASGWRHDPFGGELIDGEVWGRGAVDMLDVTASMAVAVRRLLASGFKPKGTLIYSAVADEEALGTHGAQWLTENAWDDVRSDYLVTEFGGARLPLSGPPK